MSSAGSHAGKAGDRGYADRFTAAAAHADTRSAEQWARAIFEGPRRPVRWMLLFGWRAGLGFRLGPRPSKDHVLGWRIVAEDPGSIHLELRSPLMVGRLLLARDRGSITLRTLVDYRSRAGRVFWAAAAPIHRLVIPALLRRAARSTGS